MMLYYDPQGNQRAITSKRPAANTMPPVVTDSNDPEIVCLRGIHMQESCPNRSSVFRLTQKQLAKGILVTGAARSGKTNVIMEIVRQEINHMQPGDRMVILDIKGDYSERFGGENSMEIGPHTYANCWNLFEDIMAFGMDPSSISLHANELCKYLYDKQQSQQNPFFAHAAEHLTASIIIAMIRMAQETGDYSSLNNRDFVKFLDTAGRCGMDALLGRYEDMKAARGYLGDLNSPMTNETHGVLSEVYLMRNLVFQGAFQAEGEFSPVQFIRSGSGILILRADPAIADTVNPVLRYFLDMMLAALSSGTTRQGKNYFILDEFSQLPVLKKMDAQALLSFKNLSIIAGMQSISMMLTQYPEAAARNMLGLYQSIICLNTTDPSSVKYIQERFGKTMVRQMQTTATGGLEPKVYETDAVKDYELMNLSIGEAYILYNRHPFRFYFHDYSQPRNRGAG